MDSPYRIQEADRQAAEEYRGFLPARIFDAHTHIYLREATPLEEVLHPGYTAFVRSKCSYEEYCHDMAVMLPGVEKIRLNMMPMPDPLLNDRANGLLCRANAHVMEQQRLHPDSVASVYILPENSAQEIFDLASHPGVRGLKPYFYATGRWQGEEFEIPDFLPESAWEVSAHLRIPIILHIKKQNLADGANFSYIERMARRYPAARLVLAHCARAGSWEQIRAIERLKDGGNIWFDLSSCASPGAIIACILKSGGKRVVWGSDYAVSMYRGGGDAPVFLGIGNLRAFCTAARQLCLDRSAIEDLFYNNACALFGVEP